MEAPDVAVLQLRAVTPADIPELAEFMSRVLSGDWTAEALGKLLQSSHLLRVLTVVSDDREAIAGFAECRQILDEVELLNIAIARHWQGRGLGRELLARLLAELAGRGCARCLLEVRRSNTPALRLYERAGFTLDGVRKNYYPGADSADSSAGTTHGEREDALLYSLSLSRSC